jgi:hypothetical protein
VHTCTPLDSFREVGLIRNYLAMKLAWTLATLLARVALADVVEDRATSGNW